MYDKAFECLKAMRETCVKEDEAVTFNIFLHEFKKEFSSGQHQPFFQRLINERISLITVDESFRAGNVSKEDAD